MAYSYLQSLTTTEELTKYKLNNRHRWRFKVTQDQYSFEQVILLQRLLTMGNGKVKSDASQLAHQAGAYLGFSGMKRSEENFTSPGWGASPSQG